MDEPAVVHHSDWGLRPWLLAGLLGGAGLLVWLASGGFNNDLDAWRAALTALVFFGPLGLAFTLDDGRWKEPLVFAALVGLVMAGIAWRVASADRYYDSSAFWMFAGVVASALALPLFQAGFHRLRWRTSYSETHYHVWSDAITAGGALAFTGLSWLVLVLLSELFSAIEITFIRDLIEDGWFGWTFSGIAFGAALGTLRNQLKIIGTLQNVVLLVFSLIAVPLAVALVLFLLAVALSGIDVLWQATRSATPLLLALAAGSFVLVNAVLRDEDAAASKSRIMRIAATILALGILPLSILAAISMGTRIAQHGLSPERIWGLIAIVVAVAYGIAYFVSAIRSRRLGWDTLRRANLHLAVATCLIALLLAMPLLDFGAISARNQVARLESGAVSAEDFDYDALRWDFGEAGRKALARLIKNPDTEIAALAKEAQEVTERRYRWDNDDSAARADRLANLRTDIPAGPVRDKVERLVRGNPYRCTKPCVALDTGPAPDGRRWIAFVEEGVVSRDAVYLDAPASPSAPPPPEAVPAERVVPQSPTSTVEIREWTGRRVYIDGNPAGQPFE